MHKNLTHLNAYNFIYSKWCYQTTLGAGGAIICERGGTVYCTHSYKLSLIVIYLPRGSTKPGQFYII